MKEVFICPAKGFFPVHQVETGLPLVIHCWDAIAAPPRADRLCVDVVGKILSPQHVSFARDLFDLSFPRSKFTCLNRSKIAACSMKTTGQKRAFIRSSRKQPDIVYTTDEFALQWGHTVL